MQLCNFLWFICWNNSYSTMSNRPKKTSKTITTPLKTWTKFQLLRADDGESAAFWMDRLIWFWNTYNGYVSEMSITDDVNHIKRNMQNISQTTEYGEYMP